MDKARESKELLEEATKEFIEFCKQSAEELRNK